MVVEVGIELRLAVAAARQQASFAPVMLHQVVQCARADSIHSGCCSRRPAAAMPLIISAFQLARILSSRPGVRVARSASSGARTEQAGGGPAVRTGIFAEPGGVGEGVQVPAPLEIGGRSSRSGRRTPVFVGLEQCGNVGRRPHIELAFSPSLSASRLA